VGCWFNGLGWRTLSCRCQTRPSPRRSSTASTTRTTKDNKVYLHNTGQPLGVECLGCGRRGLAFNNPKAFADLRGDMTRLRKLKFKCTKCGGGKVELWTFHNREDRERFLATTMMAMKASVRDGMDQDGWLTVESYMGYAHDVPEIRRAVVDKLPIGAVTAQKKSA
jgi:hypothetical protein